MQIGNTGSNSAKRASTRSTIGFLLSDSPISSPYVRLLWKGTVAQAERSDVDLICFQSCQSWQGRRFLEHNLTLLSQMNTNVLDGVIVIGPIDDRFVEHIPCIGNVPTVTIQASRFSYLEADNHKGMTGALEHLWDAHGRRTIAFVRGTAGESSGEVRYRAYLEFLAAHGLQPSPDLVFQGMYQSQDGMDAVREFLDVRRARPDAIVAANDQMALGVLSALAARDIDVPDEVAVIGFDDVEEASHCEPPLTTVRQPLATMGAKAVLAVVGAIRGEKLVAREIVDTQLVCRRSCGCLSVASVSARTVAVAPSRLELLRVKPRSLAAARAEVVAAATLHGNDELRDADPQWANSLLSALIAAVEEGRKIEWTRAIEKLLSKLADLGIPLIRAHGALSALRSACLAVLVTNPRQYADAEGYWHEARVLISEAERRRLLARLTGARKETETLSTVVGTLAGARDISSMLGQLALGLKTLRIPTVYLLLHEESKIHPVQYSRLVMAYLDGQQQAVAEEDGRYSTRQLLPARLRRAHERQTLLVIPIFFSEIDNDQPGAMIFDIAPVGTNADICHALVAQLTFALKNAIIIEGISTEVQQRQAAEVAAERELQAFLQTISAMAEGDLTQRCIENDQTLGKIGRSVNDMIHRFSEILSDAHGAAISVSESASRIMTAATKIAEGAKTGQDQIQAMMSSAQEMDAAMVSVSQETKLSADNTRQVHMHTRTTDDAMDSAYQAITKMDATIRESATKMRLLDQRSHEILDVVSLIGKISMQSRLLSLNATIQAATAGEAGHGFAVVADELRRLADHSKQASTEVEQKLRGLVEDTHPVTAALMQAMHEAKGGRELSGIARANLREISMLMEKLAQTSATIASAADKQTKATEKMVVAMQHIAEVAVRSTENAADTSREVGNLVSLANRLNQSIACFKIEHNG